MKRKKIDSQTEEQIVTAMVMSKEFLSQSLGVINVELMRAKHLQQIAKWCSKYYERYREAPRGNIEPIYQSWVRKGKAQDEVVDAVFDVLEHLSDQFEQEPDINVPYLLDSTADYFNTRRLETLKDELEYTLTEGDKDAATQAVAVFTTVASQLDLGIDPLNNDEAWDAAYAESQQPLIKWGNKAADMFFGEALCRDGLIAVLAPEKRGKTWWCVEFALRAVAQRRRVALFEVGDMSQSQILRRIGVRLSNRPMFKKHVGSVQVPKRITREGSEIDVEHREIECPSIANAGSSKKAIKRFFRKNGMKEGDPYFKISTHANSAINVQGIDNVIDQWENYEGYIPDIIIIDYPDILAPEASAGGMQARDQVNQTWKALRRLSQERHCLVIAPTQADAASYGVETLDASNFSEDKRKMAHVTGMLGLNQKPEEKSEGRMRLNWIALRESEFATDLCLHVGQCLTLGRAFCCATL